MFVAIAVLAGTAGAAAGLPAGTYVTEGGWGTMILQPEAGDRQPFAIESVGANAHVCSVQGAVRNGLATVPTTSGDPACKVRFQPKGGGIEVSITDAQRTACQHFCGARAAFDGTYLALPAACERAAMDKRFKAAYRARQYAQAQAAIEPFVRDCARFTDWAALASLRNDLAITRFHLGDLAGCRKALEPLREYADASDDALKQKYPPTDADTAIDIAQATRFNWRKCAAR
ncbi:MAG: hypothetical protein V4864_08125 [Pseudomonadota bacterium]